MPTFTHGLVVGKFYPPHLGHHHLIEEAAHGCSTVSVLVMAACTESISLHDRMAWLRKTHVEQPKVVVLGILCDAPVDLVNDSVWVAQVEIIKAALRRNRRPDVDAVFTNEGYGHELAARLAATSVCVDPGRRAIPISGSQIRADLPGHWDFLTAPTRAGLATRVVVLGAESTGTTTVAKLLTEHYREKGGVWRRTTCVAEFGREYTSTKWSQALSTAASNNQPAPPLEALVWTEQDFDVVGTTQTANEEQAALEGSPLLVCDTDAFATYVWERRYLGVRARSRQRWASDQLPGHAVYLLTSHSGVPWHDDGLREGDLALRAAMTDWFADALTDAGHSWVLLSGTLNDRVALAIRVTDHALRHRLTFGPAITDSREISP